MITEKLITEAKELASIGPTKYQTPPQQLVDIAYRIALDLAKRLKADEGIVAVGSLLMDVELGEAVSQEKLAQHIAMGVLTTKQLLEKYPELTEETKANIVACVAEHHGKEKFYSIESEICANADCYKFASVEGFTNALRYLRPMPMEKMIPYLESKLEEKWEALTIVDCKKELESQYNAIKKFLSYLQS